MNTTDPRQELADYRRDQLDAAAHEALQDYIPDEPDPREFLPWEED